MRLRPRRRHLVVWSSSGRADRGSSAGRAARRRRTPWWLRTAMLLALIGIVRAARFARVRWEPVSLGFGTVLMVIGFMLPAAFITFILGMLVLVVTLLKGIAAKGRAAGQAADCWQWRG